MIGKLVKLVADRYRGEGLSSASPLPRKEIEAVFRTALSDYIDDNIEAIVDGIVRSRDGELLAIPDDVSRNEQLGAICDLAKRTLQEKGLWV